MFGGASKTSEPPAHEGQKQGLVDFMKSALGFGTATPTADKPADSPEHHHTVPEEYESAVTQSAQAQSNYSAQGTLSTPTMPVDDEPRTNAAITEAQPMEQHAMSPALAMESRGLDTPMNLDRRSDDRLRREDEQPLRAQPVETQHTTARDVASSPKLSSHAASHSDIDQSSTVTQPTGYGTVGSAPKLAQHTSDVSAPAPRSLLSEPAASFDSASSPQPPSHTSAADAVASRPLPVEPIATSGVTAKSEHSHSHLHSHHAGVVASSTTPYLAEGQPERALPLESVTSADTLGRDKREGAVAYGYTKSDGTPAIAYSDAPSGGVHGNVKPEGTPAFAHGTETMTPGTKRDHKHEVLAGSGTADYSGSPSAQDPHAKKGFMSKFKDVKASVHDKVAHVSERLHHRK